MSETLTDVFHQIEQTLAGLLDQADHDKQSQRVVAAKAAAEILDGRRDLFTESMTMVDLIGLASWIHTGLDPYDPQSRGRAPDAASWTP
jgi:hypothetical protein